MARDHRFVGARMVDAVDGTLSPRQQARVARHVDECPQCGPMLRALIRLRVALGEIGPPAPPASVVDGVLERLRREDAPGRA